MKLILILSILLEVVDTSERFDLIRDWAATRGLYDEGDSHRQYVKLQEEAGELAKALLTR